VEHVGEELVGSGCEQVGKELIGDGREEEVVDG
jgi:hypothetical protein